MLKNKAIAKTAAFVKVELSGEGTGHDWWHAWRVWNLSRKIAKKEKADLFIVELAALLHDVEDWKFSDGKGQKVRKWLRGLGLDAKVVGEICGIISSLSFKGAGVKSKMNSVEGKVVQDADRLDAIGAIGISRAFAYGGMKGREIHNPEIRPVAHQSFRKYKNNKGTSINHFYEKLLLLKDRMNTKTGKQLAKRRHEFLKIYLKEFFREWNG